MLLKNSSRYTEKGPNTSEDRDLWYFDNASKIIEKSGHDNTLVTRWTLREKGVTVLGPEPATFMQRIEPNELRREIRDDLINWGKETGLFSSTYFNRFHQAFFVLNSCRVLQGLHEGRVTSKLEGLGWAKDHLDPRWIRLSSFVGKNGKTQAFQFNNQQIPKSSGNQWSLSVMLLSSRASTSCLPDCLYAERQRSHGVRSLTPARLSLDPPTSPLVSHS